MNNRIPLLKTKVLILLFNKKKLECISVFKKQTLEELRKRNLDSNSKH